MTMDTPDFFAAVPRIRLYDPLAAFLGAAAGGVLEYGYVDAVKLAGHSCPTVASAYWLTRQALRALYGDDLPERGAVRVELAADIGDGVAGVVANVASLLAGAAGMGGFKGLGGRFDRRHLLAFAADIPLELRYSRVDGRGRVDAAARLDQVPASPDLAPLLQRCLAGIADASERREFGRLWQDRVRRLLLEHAEDPAVFVVRESCAQGRAGP
jgi:hypothetical protein